MGEISKGRLNKGFMILTLKIDRLILKTDVRVI